MDGGGAGSFVFPRTSNILNCFERVPSSHEFFLNTVVELPASEANAFVGQEDLLTESLSLILAKEKESILREFQSNLRTSSGAS
jgi:hypothetical protein